MTEFPHLKCHAIVLNSIWHGTKIGVLTTQLYLLGSSHPVRSVVFIVLIIIQNLLFVLAWVGPVWQELASLRATTGSIVCFGMAPAVLCPLLMPSTLQNVLGCFFMLYQHWCFSMQHLYRCSLCETIFGAFHVAPTWVLLYAAPTWMHFMLPQHKCFLHGTSRSTFCLEPAWNLTYVALAQAFSMTPAHPKWRYLTEAAQSTYL